MVKYSKKRSGRKKRYSKRRYSKRRYSKRRYSKKKYSKKKYSKKKYSKRRTQMGGEESPTSPVLESPSIDVDEVEEEEEATKKTFLLDKARMEVEYTRNKLILDEAESFLNHMTVDQTESSLLRRDHGIYFTIFTLAVLLDILPNMTLHEANELYVELSTGSSNEGVLELSIKIYIQLADHFKIGVRALSELGVRNLDDWNFLVEDRKKMRLIHAKLIEKIKEERDKNVESMWEMKTHPKTFHNYFQHRVTGDIVDHASDIPEDERGHG